MTAGMSFYEICAFFLIYAFIGWVIEVIYHAVTTGKIINRGFLCGPLCPVYGFGMITVLMVVHAAEQTLHVETANGGIVFISSLVLATFVELIAGWALDCLFHMRWWDYSNVPFNFRGYICLKFSIYWGIGGIIAVMITHPAICRITTQRIPEKIGWIVMAVMYLLLIADLFVTAACVQGLNKRLKEIDSLRDAMRAPSDHMTERIASRTIRTANVIEHTRVQAALAEAELKEQLQEQSDHILGQVEELQEKMHQAHADAQEKILRVQLEMQEYKTVREKRINELKEKITKRNVLSRRMLKAFPDMKHRDYGELLKELKESVNKK